MTKTEDIDENYFATVSPDGDGWKVRYYAEGYFDDSDIYTFRWFARRMARRQVKRMRKDSEIIR